MNKLYNCEIVVKQKNGDSIDTMIFNLDDYRVATAIQNILCNVEHVDATCKSYKVRKGNKYR